MIATWYRRHFLLQKSDIVFAIARSRALRVCCVIVAVFGRERAIANQGHWVLPLVYPWFGVLWPVGLFFFLLFSKFWIVDDESG